VDIKRCALNREKQADYSPPPYILGLDIGGTKIAMVLGTLNAEIVCREEFKTPATLPFDAAMEIIAASLGEFLSNCNASGFETPIAISISVGGPLDIEKGILYTPPHLVAWGEAHLKEHLQEKFAMPVFVEHDGNAGALAEFHFGAGRGAHNVIFLTMGTGLGAGIILNGAIYHGSTDSAGEVGHIRLSEEGPEEYGKVGSWEAFSCGSGIARLARLRNPAAFAEGTTTGEVVKRSLAGDPAAVEIIREAGEWLGKGMAILVDILNPELIIVGTLGVVLGDLLFKPARRLLDQEALPISARACQIVPAQLGSKLMDVGCLMAGLNAYRSGKIVIQG
jgi:glucokinase